MIGFRHALPGTPLLAAAALAIGGCGDEDRGTGASAPATIPQPSRAQLAAAGLAGLPLAPASERVDLAAPTFSEPLEITNPLFPISDLHSTILNGHVDDQHFHTETTLLPRTRYIEWADGQVVEAQVLQYMAFLDGRIQEATLDYYAQSDDGAVWYLGEDVYDFGRQGTVNTTEGTWLAGREGPPEMIMPADPQVGDVHRVENIPAVAFEEVEIKAVDRTFDGPRGPVAGGIVGRELHDDGSYSDKRFAPGYGEFYTAHRGEVEALALSVPTDALGGPTPPELEAIAAAGDDAFAAARAGNRRSADDAAVVAQRSWAAYRAAERVPPRLAPEMERAIGSLVAASGRGDAVAVQSAAIQVSRAALDLQLRHRAPAQVDFERFELWARQTLADVKAGDLGAAAGDVMTMVWVRDRFAHTLDPADLTSVDAALLELRGAAADRDRAALDSGADRLLDTLAQIRPPGAR
jgi:hypothetical protein